MAELLERVVVVVVVVENIDDIYVEHEYVQFGDMVSLDNDLQAQVDDSRKQIHKYMILLQFFFLIDPSCFSFILVVYLLGEVDAFTPILCIFSFVPIPPFVSLTFPWT